MATHMLRSIIELGRITGMTAIMPLYDLKNAYYEVLREMVLPMGTDKVEIQAKLETYGIPQCLQGLVELLLHKPAVTKDNCPEYLVSLQVQAHMDTWLQVKEIPLVARATTGSRPGTSLADYLF